MEYIMRKKTYPKKSNVVNAPIIASLKKLSFPKASAMAFLLFFIALLPMLYFALLLRVCCLFKYVRFDRELMKCGLLLMHLLIFFYTQQ